MGIKRSSSGPKMKKSTKVTQEEALSPFYAITYRLGTLYDKWQWFHLKGNLAPAATLAKAEELQRIVHRMYGGFADVRVVRIKYISILCRDKNPNGRGRLMAENKYGKITASNGIFPVDEPLFLLRAQDELAAKVVRYYAELREKIGDSKGAKQCRDVAKAMDAWPTKKRPD